jgi:hypothetical protein
MMSFFTLWDRWLSNLELRAYSILLPVYEIICRPVRRAYFEFKQIKRNKKAGIDWKKAQQNFATENNSTAEQVNSSNERPLDLSAYARVEYTSIDRAEYLKILSQSKTSVSVRGAGCECYRYWELPAKGLVMIADEHELPIENDFTDEQIFKFKNLNDLEQILIKLKTVSPEVLEEMALKSLQHTVKYHTPKKRAEYILRKIYNVS